MDIVREIVYYQDEAGHYPFSDWLAELKDVRARSIIRSRLLRCQLGNYGDCKFVGRDIFELRIHFGPGYRVYFSEHQRKLVVILCAGDKARQAGDIIRAQLYWQNYKGRNFL